MHGTHGNWMTLWIVATLAVSGLCNQQGGTHAAAAADDNSTTQTEAHETHGIHVVSWRFDELSAPVIISVFMLAVSILKVRELSSVRTLSVVSKRRRFWFANFGKQCIFKGAKERNACMVPRFHRWGD